MKRVRGDGEGEDPVDEAAEVAELDEAGARRLALRLERAVSRNLEARAASSEATRWVESELELDEAVAAMSAAAASPSVYVALVRARAHETLSSLLAHENADVATGVLRVLGELLEDQAEEEEERLVEALAGELAEAGAVGAALANWGRLQQTHEGGGPAVEATVEFLERMHARDPETAEGLAAAKGFLGLAARSFLPATAATEEAALAVSELLSTAVMSGTEALAAQQQAPAERAAVLDPLLGLVNRLGRSTKSISMPEAETLSNVANAIANLVQLPGWAEAFSAGQGVQLMCKLLEKEGNGVVCAARLLSFATQDNSTFCEELVEAGGLVPIFSLWKLTEWPKKMAKRFGWGADEFTTLSESLVEVLHNACSLLGHETMQQLRVWKKFNDNDGEAVVRAAQRWSEYRSVLAGRGLMVTEAATAELDQEEADELLMQRLDAGYSTLTQLTLLIIWLACVPTPLQESLRKHIGSAVKAHGIRWHDVNAMLLDHKKRTGYDIYASITPQVQALFLP